MIEIVDVSERFGERVARLREERGMKPHELAQAIRATEGMIRKIENGDTKSATFQNGLLLARALGCDAWYLAFGQEGPPAPTSADASPTVQEMRRELAALREVIEKFVSREH